MAGMPPRAMPSSIRRPRSIGKLEASGTSSPRTVAAEMPHIMARTRPIRSARKDHGRTVTASPTVASEMVSAASAAVTCRSAAIMGSTAWVE
ncbi:hypothetical protein BJG92_00781 [Arthrobacter sp. SO5]|nr:hypothetical protein [Arthrobacter sp. SO5]